MKLQLDTTNKTVKIEENIKVSKLISTLKALLPNDWKEFTLETNVTINNWGSPIIIKEYPQRYPYYDYPWYYGTTVKYSADMKSGENLKGHTTEANYSLKDGIFNVEA